MMFDNSFPDQLHTLSCFLLGLSVALVHSLSNFDVYLLLRYMGLSLFEVQGIWYFVRKFNLAITGAIIIIVILCGSATRRAVYKWSWILFFLYGGLLWHLYHNRNFGARLTWQFQWLLLGISVVSSITQCLSIFYIFDPNAPGPSRKAPVRLLSYILGYSLSGCLAGLLGYFKTDIDRLYVTGRYEIVNVLSKTLLIYTTLTFLSALVTTALVVHHWEEPCMEYISLSIGGITTFLMNYDSWIVLLLAVMGWVIAPFCGLLLSTFIFKVSMIENATVITHKHLAFLLIPILSLVTRLFCESDLPNACDADLLKRILCDVVRTKHSTTPATIYGYGKCNERTDVKPTSAPYRLLRDIQPWQLLPHGVWTSWCDYDSEDTRHMVQCLGAYVKLHHIRKSLTSGCDAGISDCMSVSENALAPHYHLLVETRRTLLWELACYISRYGEVYKSVEGMTAGSSTPSCPTCRFESLSCSLCSCLTCQNRILHYKCATCVYTKSGLFEGTRIFVKNTIYSSICKAKDLCVSLNGSCHFSLSPGEVEEELLLMITGVLESYMCELIQLLLNGRLIDEWLFLCKSMQAIDTNLVTILDRICTERSELHSHLQECKHGTGKTDSSVVGDPSSSAGTLGNGQAAPTGQTSYTKCGCGLVAKMFECAFLLHRKQCDVATIMTQYSCSSLEDTIPTLSHVRTTVMLLDHYNLLTERAVDDYDPCQRCKPTNATCRNICSHYNPQLDELLDMLLSDIDQLTRGDQILTSTINLLSCIKRNDLTMPIRSPQREPMLGKYLSDIMLRSYTTGWNFVDFLIGGVSFTHKNHHCACKATDGWCSQTSDGSSSKEFRSPCNECLGIDCCQDDCANCKTMGCCDTDSSECETDTCNCDDRVKCQCSSESLPPVPLMSACTKNATGAVTTCESSTENASILGVLSGLCCLTNGISGCWVIFVRSLCCPNDTQTSIATNVCNFEQYMTYCCNSEDTATCFTKGNAKENCINRNVRVALKSLFTATNASSHTNCDNTVDGCCGNDHCIGCIVSRPCNDHPSGESSLKGLFEHLKCIATCMSCITCDFSAICTTVTDIRLMGKCLSGFVCCICDLYDCITTTLCDLVNCAKEKAMKLKKSVETVKTKQKTNIDALNSNIDTLNHRLNTLKSRSTNYKVALNVQAQTMHNNSRLMDDLNGYANQIHERISKMSTLIRSTRRSIYMDYVKDVLYRLLHLKKEQHTSSPCYSIFYVLVSLVILLLLVLSGIGIDFLPSIEVSSSYGLYRFTGIIGALIASYFITSGFVSFAKMPRQAGYLINLVILIGTAAVELLSWVSQGYAYRSYMIEQFNAYSKNYRVMYPDYVDPHWNNLRWWYDGLVSLVRADVMAISDVLYTKDILYNCDPYRLGFSSRFSPHSRTAREFGFRWTETHAMHDIKTGILNDSDDNLHRFFDYFTFVMLDYNHFNFLTDDASPGSNTSFAVELLWQAWAKGSKVTKGHQEVYNARIEALDLVSAHVLAELEKDGLRNMLLKKRFRDFQRLQYGQAGKRCTGLPFTPQPIRFSVQHKNVVSLFVTEYTELWGITKEEEDVSTPEDPVTGTKIMREDLLQLCNGWKAYKLGLCESVYQGNKICTVLVSRMAGYFEDFLRSTCHVTSYASIGELYDAYDEYRKGLDYEVLDMFVHASAGVSPEASALAMAKEQLSRNSDGMMSSTDAIPSSLGGAYGIAHSLSNSEASAHTDHMNQMMYLLGEWLKIQAVSLPRSAVGLLFNVSEP